jgi:hypothetical protein
MARVLVLIVLVFFFSQLLSRKSRRSRKGISPYTTSLDSLLAAEEVSLELEKSELYHPRAVALAEPGPSPVHRTGVIRN